MSYTVNGPWDISKQLQYVEESIFGSTPDSPTFTNAGNIIDLRLTLNEAIQRYRRLGSEDIYKQLETGELYSFEIVLQPVDDALIKYGSQAQGGGAGSIDKSLSFLYSEDINGTENFVIFEGAKCDRTRIEVTPASVLLTQNWLCQNITTPATSAGIGTPTYASASTDTPLVGADGGSNPFTHNSLNYDVDRFVIDIARNLDAIQVNGQTQISFLVPTNRDVTGEFDVLQKNTTLEADMKTATQRAATYALDSGTITATFTNMVLESMRKAHSATANEAPRHTFTYSATAISID